MVSHCFGDLRVVGPLGVVKTSSRRSRSFLHKRRHNALRERRVRAVQAAVELAHALSAVHRLSQKTPNLTDEGFRNGTLTGCDWLDSDRSHVVASNIYCEVVRIITVRQSVERRPKSARQQRQRHSLRQFVRYEESSAAGAGGAGESDARKFTHQIRPVPLR